MEVKITATYRCHPGRDLAYGGGAAQDGPITYELDGRQDVPYGASGVLYAFALPAGLVRPAR